MSSEKKTVILSLGPLHLFWTTGVYYLFEISRTYNVVLIAWDNYEGDPDFQHAIAKFNVIETIYIPVGGSIKRNWFLARAFRKLSNRRKISLVFQHEHTYGDNLYLQHCIFKHQPDCKFISYQNGMEIVGSSADDFRARMAIGISGLSSRYGLSFIMASWLYTAKIRILYFANFVMLPLLFVGTFFRPGLNVYTGKKPKHVKRQRPPCDYILAYTKEEIGAYNPMPEGSMFTCVLIRHPVETIGRECNSLIYGGGNVDERNLIVLFPSGGTVETLVSAETTEQTIIDDVSQKWIGAITILKDVYPGYRMVWKLHPGAASRHLQLAIQGRVSRDCPFLDVVDSESNAQQWILRAKVVVSEVSTTLWWAYFIPGKITVSLDLFNYKGGDEMKYHSGINYCNNLSKLKEILMQQTEPSYRQGQPTLNEFLRAIHAN